MSEHKKFELSPSISIIIAGVIVAGAIIFTNMRGPVAEAQQAGAQKAPTTQTNVKAPSTADHIIGSPTAPLVLIEYSDFQCPFCSLIYPTLKKIVDGSNGQIAWVYRHFPLESIHPQARGAAMASECVFEQLGDQGFWKFGETLFENQATLSSSYFEQVAQSLGADMTKFKSCVASNKYANKIDADAQEAMQNGGQGTPYTVLYDKKGQVGVSGALPYETFTQVISAFQKR